MEKSDTSGMKLYSGGKEVTKEQVEAAIADYKKKIASPEYQQQVKEYAEFRKKKPPSVQKQAPLPWEKAAAYYEFPNGVVVKHIPAEGVYRFNRETGAWEADHSLTAEFAWDRPWGAPCAHLRQKVEVSGDLPPFPQESAFRPGNTVLIGAYPQKTPYDFSPIPWIVLETDGSTALCISKDCLITSGYCDPQKAYGNPHLLWWENSLAREICNHRFFVDAFSEAEKARIVPRKLSDLQLGGECTDAVFLLSERELQRWFPTDPQRKAMPTPCALQNGALVGWSEDTKRFAAWWILPEENAYGFQDGSVYPKAVCPTGEIQFHGRNIYHTDFTIRPCIQIKYR